MKPSTDSSVVIRKASPEDTAAIARFNIRMARETENLELHPDIALGGTQRLIENDNLGFYLVAVADRKIAGSLMITTEWSDWRNGQFWWIQSVYVLPAFRRQGLYRRLYRTVKDLAAGNPDVCGFRLYVERDNAVARKTYGNVGMHETPYRVFEELRPDLRFLAD